MEPIATVFDIQRFCLSDGPGIRTLVFFKGCPLRCLWCSNPESQSPHPEIIYYATLCLGCRSCQQACPQKAISFGSGGVQLDRDKCDLCGLCVMVCPGKALKMVGRRYQVEELAQEVLRDQLFFESSGGGVTASGGEPLMQAEAVVGLLARMKYCGIGTAVETCGLAPPEALAAAMEVTDLFLFDLKQLDEARHREGTGSSSRVIQESLRNLVQAGANLRLRVPLIPGYNFDEEFCTRLSGLVRQMELPEVDLLPYHRLGLGKYQGLGRQYALQGLDLPVRSEVEEFARRLAQGSGAQVRIEQ